MKTTLILVIGLIFSGLAIAQDQHPDWTAKMQDPTTNFFELQAEFNAYWEGREHEKGDGYKPFKRWEHWAQKRLNADGTVRSAGEYMRLWEDMEEYKASRSLNGNWEQLGPIIDGTTTRDDIPGVGRINAIAFHPTDDQILYAGAPAGGLWKTTNGGEWWVNLTDDLPTLGVSAIVIDPNNPDVIYIGTGDRDSADAPGLGVYKSTDGGDTWEASNLGMSMLVVGMMAINPEDTDIVFAATNDGVYRSTNAGGSWSLVSAASNFKDIKMHPTNPDIIYATGSTSFYKSTNGGASFEYIPGTVSFSSRSVIGVCPVQPDLVYVCGANTTDFRAFFKSEDAGENWEEVADEPNLLGWSNNASGGQAWYDFAMAVNPQNPLDIFVGGVRVLRSQDGGVTWQEATNNYVHVDHHYCEFSPHTNNFWLGNDGGIYEYEDNQIWHDKSNGMVVSQMYKLGQSPFNVNNVLTGFQDNGTSEWNGNKWQRRIGADGMECMYDHQDPDYFYGAIQYGQVRRTGPDFTAQTCANSNFGGIDENGGSWVTPYKLDVENSNTMYLGYLDLWRCDNIKTPNVDDIQWEQLTDNLLNNDGANVNEICQSPVNPDIMYISKQTRKLFRKDDINDPESEWINLSSNLPQFNLTIDDLEPHPFDENILYMAFFREVYKSPDKGESWELMTEDFPDVEINSIAYDSNSDEGLYIGTEMGVYYKDATMTDWIPFSGGNLPGAVNVTELEIYYGEDISTSRIRAATYGRGLWESDLYDSETYYFPAKAEISSENTEGEIYGEIDLSVKFYKNLNYVDAETLEISEIEVTNGTITAISGGPLEYIITLEPTSFGEVTVFIPDGVAQDVFGVDTEHSEVLSIAYNDVPDALGIYGPGGVGNEDELSYWFMADENMLFAEGGVPALDQGEIGYWGDVSGNGVIAVQEDGLAKPKYIESSELFNGMPAMEFTEEQTFLRTSETAVKEDLTAFCVAAARNNPQGYTLWNEHGWLASAREENGFIIHPWRDAFHVTGIIYDNMNNETQGLNTIFVPGINTATIHGMQFYNNSANKFLDSYVNGNVDRVVGNQVVRDANDVVQVNFGWDFGDRYGEGFMSEQILYTERLYQTHTILVRNYLSSKYSASCDGLDRYFQDDNYFHEVTGIGQMTDYDKHLDAQGRGIIRMNSATDMDDGEFLLWGHDNEPIEWTDTHPIFESERLERTWGYDVTGDVGTVQVQIEADDLPDNGSEIGIIHLESPNFFLASTPSFTPLTESGGVWSANVSFTGTGVFTIGVQPIVSVEEEFSSSDFLIYPNPADDEVTVNFSDNQNIVSLEVYDSKGSLVLSETITSSTHRINTSGLARGSYTLIARNEDGNEVTSKLELVRGN